MRKEKRNLAITEIFMILIAVNWFIPIYYLIVTTLKSSQEATANPLGLPKVLRLDNYVNAWVNMEFPRAFGNTLFITATAVLLIVIFGSMAGYALARTKSKIGTRVFLLFLAGLIVPFQMNIVSLYKIVKGFGLMNTLWSVILPMAINVYNLVLMRNFFEGIPESLFEAAQIDGCSPMGIFFKIVLPPSKVALASIGLMFAVSFWNDYTNFKIYINKNNLYYFQIQLRSMVVDSDIPNDGAVNPATISNAATIVAILPFMIIYPFCQKYFVQGVNVGAVKE